MPRYKYSQESGTDFKVIAPDKVDAQEDTNEVRQILDDLGNLLGHSKRDDSYPKDGTSGGDIDARRVTTKSGACTLTVAEAGLILVSATAPYTIGLPTAVGNLGLTYRFVKTDNNYNLITLDAFNAQTLSYPCDAGTPQSTYARLNTLGAKVTIVSDNTNWIVIHEDSGQVPTAKVNLSAQQANIATGTWTLINYDYEFYDIGSNFNTTTHKFIVPITGKYSIVSKILWGSVIADKGWAFGVLNGAAKIQEDWGDSATTGIRTNNLLGEFALTANDEITFQAYHNAGANTPDIETGTGYNTIIKLISKD